MARGRRNDRTRPSVGSSSEVRPEAESAGVPASYETVEYEEIDQRASAGESASVAAGSTDAAVDSMREQVMAQPEDVEPVATDPVVDPQPEPEQRQEAAPQRRRGGFVPGLIGGLLGAAAIVGAGGWYAYERGPVKPTLARLDAVENAAHDAEAGVTTLGGQVEHVSTDVAGLKTALEQADSSVSGLTDRVTATEKAAADLKTEVTQASSTFRAAGDQVISRLEAVNAKLVEVEQAQPADIVDKKTVADIAAKQASIEAATKSVAEGLARLEQLVTQSLEAGNQQAQALRVVVDSNRSRMDEIITQQRDLLALKDEVEKQAEADQKQLAALAETGDKVSGVRSDLEQKLADMTTKLTALDAARERGVGLSLAAHSIETAFQSGQPFEQSVQMLNELGKGDATIESVSSTLAPLAAKGIPTYGSLAAQLEQIGQSLQPVSTAPADDWLGRTRENLEGLVNLHSVDEEAVPGENAVQTATQALLTQDLAAAVAAMKPLAESGNAAAADWVATAQQRLDAGAAIETLRQRVKTMLVQQG